MGLAVHRTQYHHTYYSRNGQPYSGRRKVRGWLLGHRIKYVTHPSGCVDLYFEMYHKVPSTRFLWWGHDAGRVYNWVHESDIEVTRRPTEVIYDCN